ncbi:hypothetical protein ACH42_00170 [Endozoicomonas sp. (ex Bugula neritina AB1)]|nr:hypothetical protein ACH42_00170 [Endozoicomonas sp. (ex Bugula neritina AB1)]
MSQDIAEGEIAAIFTPRDYEDQTFLSFQELQDFLSDSNERLIILGHIRDEDSAGTSDHWVPLFRGDSVHSTDEPINSINETVSDYPQSAGNTLRMEFIPASSDDSGDEKYVDCVYLDTGSNSKARQ